MDKSGNIFFILLLCIGFTQLNGQSAFQKELQQSLSDYNKQQFQEKVFLHTDKTFYVTGEIIWFKIYVVDGYFHKPIDLSKVSYIEILNKDNSPVLQCKIELNQGFGNGSFIIPGSLSSGNYLIRAYTNWMKNYSADLFFQKAITIVNPQKGIGRPISKDTTLYDAQFFPEGGNLVNDIKSKVAFRITNQYGKGLSCTGTIINQDNDTITTFKSLWYGIGSFYFTPRKGNIYTAIIRFENGTTALKTLPTPYQKGWAMNLMALGADSIKIIVQANENQLFTDAFLVSTIRNKINYFKQQRVNNGIAEFIIPKINLGEGINRFTIFDADRQPLCERLFFKRPEEVLDIKINTSQTEYTARKRVNVVLKSFLKNNIQPGSANISMSVLLLDSLQLEQQENILSYLFLTSELKGSIESPASYLSGSGIEADEALDNLMLSHGWRKFRWDDILQNKPMLTRFLPEYEGHLISGTITNKKTNLPEANVSTYLCIPGSNTHLSNAITDTSGNFTFNSKKMYGENEILVQARSASENSYTINITSPFADMASSYTFRPLELEEKSKPLLLERFISAQIQNTYEPEKKQQFFLRQIPDTLSFFGKPDKEYLLDDYTRFTSLEEVLREYVTEVRIKKNREQYKIEVKNLPYDYFFENDPLVLLDGVPVFDINSLIMLNPLKIKKIAIKSRKFYLGNIAEDGIVNYTTNNNDLDDYKISDNSIILPYEGLQFHREFYSPKYETSEAFQSRIPDFRNLLFWSPEIKTNAQGESQVSFYTSDIPGKYVIVVNAITNSGQTASSSANFIVK